MEMETAISDYGACSGDANAKDTPECNGQFVYLAKRFYMFPRPERFWIYGPDHVPVIIQIIDATGMFLHFHVEVLAGPSK